MNERDKNFNDLYYFVEQQIIGAGDNYREKLRILFRQYLKDRIATYMEGSAYLLSIMDQFYANYTAIIIMDLSKEGRLSEVIHRNIGKQVITWFALDPFNINAITELMFRGPFEGIDRSFAVHRIGDAVSYRDNENDNKYSNISSAIASVIDDFPRYTVIFENIDKQLYDAVIDYLRLDGNSLL